MRRRAPELGHEPAALARLILGLYEIEDSKVIPAELYDEIMFELSRYGTQEAAGA